MPEQNFFARREGLFPALPLWLLEGSHPGGPPLGSVVASASVGLGSGVLGSSA